jgi:hypothetical protein
MGYVDFRFRGRLNESKLINESQEILLFTALE